MYNYMLHFCCTNYNGTNCIRPKQLILLLFSFCGFLFVESNSVNAQARLLDSSPMHYLDQKPESQQSVCLYGEVYYRGLPVPGATINFTVNEQSDQLFTAGKRVEREIRLTPGEMDLQKVDLVIPHESVWKIWHPDMDIHDLAIRNDAMIAASKSGVRNLPWETMPEGNENSVLLSNFTFRELLSSPLLDIAATDIAVDKEDLIWALDDQQVYRQQESRNNSWITYSLPINNPFYALTVERVSNTVWVGGGTDQKGELAMYDGTEWSHVYTTETSIRTLALDSQSNLWVGTWGSGVYKRNSEGEWIQYTTENGLTSNYIHTISTLRPRIWDRETVWLGSAPIGADGAGNIDNGISFYDPIDHVWQAYTRTHGLPADEQAENAVADVYDFAVDRYGVVWAGTEKGLYLLGNDTRGHEMWILHDLDVNGLVRSIVFRGDTLIAATSDGLKTLLSNPLQPSYVSKRLILEEHPQLLKLEADSIHEYPQHEDIVWSWVSDKDGPLCSTPHTCTYPKRALQAGDHKIKLYLQEKNGRETMSESISVKIDYETFLPTIHSHK